MNHWERLRNMTLDRLVTQTKVAGSLLIVPGVTLPENWEFEIALVIRRPGEERVFDSVRRLHATLASAAGWSMKNDNPEVFVCRECGARSFNPHDKAEGYCGRCHKWTGLQARTAP